MLGSDPMTSQIHYKNSGDGTRLSEPQKSALSIELNLADFVMTGSERPSEAVVAFQNLEELTGDLREYYSSRIRPLLKDSVAKSATGSLAPLPELTELLSDDGVRMRVFLRIAAYGLPREGAPGEEELLIASLLPYVGENPLYYVAQREIASVTAKKYPKLYRALGEHCITKKIPDECLCFMTGAFLEYSTHNAKNDPTIAPWVTCFSAVQTPIVYEAMIDELLEQIQKGRLSSYDHIVSVLCATEEKLAKDYLRNFVSPPELPREAIVEPPPISLLTKVAGLATLVNFQSLLPIGAAGALIASTVTSVSIVTSISGSAAVIGLLSMGAGVANAVVFRRAAWDAFQSEYERMIEYFRGVPYEACVEKIYQKLLQPAPGKEIDKQTLALIESHPYYQECSKVWKETGQ